jgi:hypothetical protein
MGIWLWGNSNYNILEQIINHGNGWGIQIQTDVPDSTGDGHGTGNQLINCDSYSNFDPYTVLTSGNKGPWGNADGIDVHAPYGSTTYVTGCRTWNNSNDGFGILGLQGMIIMQNDWSFNNGHYQGNTSAGQGGGWGFKLGMSGSRTGQFERSLTNCLSAYNRMGGLGLNDATPGEPLCNIYNCSSIYNNTEDSWPADFDFGTTPNIPHIIVNNIAYGNPIPGNIFPNPSDPQIIENNNSWDSGYSVSSSDFVSLDSTGISGPRLANGSLPILSFAKLKTSSPLATGGTDLGLGLGTAMGFVYGVALSAK